MTVREHQNWLRQWLNQARAAVRSRDWLKASDCYRSAAFHANILKHLKEHRR